MIYFNILGSKVWFIKLNLSLGSDAVCTMYGMALDFHKVDSKSNTEYTIIQRHNLLLDLMHISGAYVAIRLAMQMDGNGINVWEEF